MKIGERKNYNVGERGRKQGRKGEIKNYECKREGENLEMAGREGKG